MLKYGQCLILAVLLGFGSSSLLYSQPERRSTHRIQLAVMGEKTVRTDLPADAFNVEEDGTPARLERVLYSDGPASVALVLDISGSMSRQPASFNDPSDFLRQSVYALMSVAHPDNEYLVIGCSTEARLLQDFTSDERTVLKSLAVKPAGRTALYDTLELAVELLKVRLLPNRAIILLSDGEDNSSKRLTASYLRERMLTERIVPFFLYPQPIAGPWESDRVCDTLPEVVRGSGGMVINVTKNEGFLPAMRLLGLALRYQYILEYVAPAGRSRSGKHQVRVKISKKIAGEKCEALGPRLSLGR
jgi:hypothetical protein